MVSLETMPAQALIMMQTIAFLTSGYNINHRNLNSALGMEIIHAERAHQIISAGTISIHIHVFFK